MVAPPESCRISSSLTPLRKFVEVPASIVALIYAVWILLRHVFQSKGATASIHDDRVLWFVAGGIFVALMAMRMAVHSAAIFRAKQVYLLQTGIRVLGLFRDEHIPFKQIVKVDACYLSNSCDVHLANQASFGKRVTFLWPWKHELQPDGPACVRELRLRVAQESASIADASTDVNGK